MKRIIILTILLAIQLVIHPNSNQGKLYAKQFETLTTQAYVSKVIDGDTITAIINGRYKITVRLYGIDAPELKQEYGLVSKQILSNTILHKNVIIKFNSTDRYNRILGIVYFNNIDINKALVANGYAWCYNKYSTKYCPDQKYAMQNKLGLWNGGNIIKPDSFRKLIKR